MQSAERVTEVTELDSKAQKFTSSRDPAPSGALVDVELVARVETNLPGHVVPPGKHVLRVTKADAAKILARVDLHPDRWQVALDAFDLEVKRAVDARFDPNGAPPTKDDLERAEREVRSTIASSPSAYYHATYGEARKPLVSAKVLPGEYQAERQDAPVAFGGLSIDEVEIILERRAKARKS